jgi:hypothetical protein
MLIRTSQYWQALGGSRPPSLLRIERALWEALFDIASGHHPVSRLIIALESVDKALDDVQPTEDRAFFANIGMLESLLL